jgi:high affinity choline transporter 7
MALFAVITMFAVFLGIGIFASRKARAGTAADLMIAGRAMPLWIATLTMTATWVDGGYLLGTVEGTHKTGITLGAQGGLCFGLSLLLGGIFFARRMRELEFTTIIDPFEARFGKRWAAVLFLPAMLGEIFWSAELLVAIGSTFGVMLGMKLTTAILLSAVVVTLYTAIGGMWSVAYTDAFQLGLVALGLLAALPFALAAVGGWEAAWQGFVTARPDQSGLLPPLRANANWSLPSILNWWDVSLMLMLGGIPWNCYFQRVLSCQSPRKAQWHSIWAGLLTVAFTLPPLVLGVVAFRYQWPTEWQAQLQSEPARALPAIFQHLVPPLVGLLGLGAIIGAVTSSFSSSILSAGSMFTWNCCYRLLRPNLTPSQMKRLMRGAITLLGVMATVLALKVQSVQALWFFTSDLIFVLLFPQLVCALFDPKANRIGSITAFVISVVLRLGGGEPLFNIPPTIPYPAMFTGPEAWYANGALLFPYKTFAALMGLLALPLVSRLTQHWDAARPLRNLSHEK